MAILLIGSTGNGKSTLGNFLIDQTKEVIFDKQIFKTAKTNLPETQNVSLATFKDKSSGKTLTVIDTPGLNDSAVRDLEHMIQIVESLQKVGKVLAFIFVVKFDSKIDAQYKSTVQYYSKLLPPLSKGNVIIVMTDYATDRRSQILRKKQGIDVDKIKRNALRGVVESGSLAYEPSLFTIDCLPLTDEEQRSNLVVREAIVSKIVSQIPLNFTELKVLKTASLKNEDKLKIKVYEGEKRVYNARLEDTNTRAKETRMKMFQKLNDVTRQEMELQILHLRLALTNLRPIISSYSFLHSMVHARQRRALEEQINEAKKHREHLQKHFMEIKDSCEEYTDNIVNLEKLIHEKERNIRALDGDYMTLHEAKMRLTWTKMHRFLTRAKLA